MHCLDACRPALEAEDKLRAGEVGDSEIYDVVFQATGSKDIAADALAARIRWRLERGQKPRVYS